MKVLHNQFTACASLCSTGEKEHAETDYTAVIRPAISAKLRENAVSRACVNTPARGQTPGEREPDMRDFTDLADLHEALLRLTAIEVWARHGVNGDCAVSEALTAISELVAAASAFLSTKAA